MVHTTREHEAISLLCLVDAIGGKKTLELLFSKVLNVQVLIVRWYNDEVLELHAQTVEPILPCWEYGIHRCHWVCVHSARDTCRAYSVGRCSLHERVVSATQLFIRIQCEAEEWFLWITLISEDPLQFCFRLDRCCCHTLREAEVFDNFAPITAFSLHTLFYMSV